MEDYGKVFTAVAYLRKGILELEKQFAYEEKSLKEGRWEECFPNETGLDKVTVKYSQKGLDSIKEQIEAFQFAKKILVNMASNLIKEDKSYQKSGINFQEVSPDAVIIN